MKKHNEGYVLPFVLVVLVVVCLVAVSLLTASLDNLKRQQASIERMEAKYEAQGKVEAAVVELGLGKEMTYDAEYSAAEDTEANKTVAAEEARKGAYSTALSLFGLQYDGNQPTIDSENGLWIKEFPRVETIDQWDESGTVKVSAAVGMKVIITVNAPEVVWNDGLKKYQTTTAYTIDYENVSYTSYTISHEGGGLE